MIPLHIAVIADRIVALTGATFDQAIRFAYAFEAELAARGYRITEKDAPVLAHVPPMEPDNG